MRILLMSRAFHPNIGGLETAGFIFAQGFLDRGHDVTVVTMSPGATSGYPFKIVRQPSARALFDLVRWSDLVWQNNVSLRSAWPLALVRRPLIVTHQGLLGPEHGAGRFLALLKRAFCARARNVFISTYLAETARLPGTVIPNPYDDAMFRVLNNIRRDRGIAFLGRLVPDKGADVLIDALTILAAKQISIRATLIGDGPERNALEQRATAAGLADSVVFLGALSGEPLVEELNRHQVLVVPSRWCEPFGIVALEGAACGCVVVGTAGGGLPEAIGPCGPTVPNGDPVSLANCLGSIVTNADVAAGFRENASRHLEKFTVASVLAAYAPLVTEATQRVS